MSKFLATAKLCKLDITATSGASVPLNLLPDKFIVCRFAKPLSISGWVDPDNKFSDKSNSTNFDSHVKVVGRDDSSRFSASRNVCNLSIKPKLKGRVDESSLVPRCNDVNLVSFVME